MVISGFEKIISIDKFEYLSSIDRHAVCSFSASIRAEGAEAALKMAGRDIRFEDDSFKFTGQVDEVAVYNDISGVFIDVKAVGKTSLCDKDKHRRVFQQGDKTVSDVLSYLRSMSDIVFRCSEDPKIESILYQNDETDWKFFVRLINRFGIHIFPQEKTFIGKYGPNQTELKKESLIDYKIIAGSNKSTLACRTDRALDLGCRVNFSGKQYYVGSKKYVLERAKYYYDYVLYEIKADAAAEESSVNAYLYAKVTDNDDPDKKGRLKVNFENDNTEDCMKDSPVWIDRLDMYASKGFGPVFIPQIGDTVRVHLYNGDSKIVGCVRTDAYGSPYESCDHKYLLLDEDTFIRYGDGKITIRRKENIVEVLGEEILIASGDSTAVSASSDKLLIQTDKAAIEITSDINASGGGFIIEAGGEASISGSSVNIKGNSGVCIN